MFEPMKWISGFLLLIFAATPAHAQTKLPAETRNAALRYWLAFAELQDPPADKAVADLLEKTAAGEAAWNEEKLGPILDQNEAAITKMQRATQLPDCDWGLEYDLGPRASIAYVPKARVLARLNTLQGMRLAAKGETQKAIDAWLAGIRFSEDLSKGGTLIFALVAKMGMISNFHALTRAAGQHAFTAGQKKQIGSVVGALPQTGLYWGQALWYEEATLNVAIREMKEAKSPADYYREVTGKAAPSDFTMPNKEQIAAFQSLMSKAEEALRLPPDVSREKLQPLQDSVKTLHPFFQDLMPSLTRINQARIELETARQQLMQAIAAK
ncbi:MAG TPA: hypothetical protein VJN93_16660 [Candidatus Acidoferrum sp.]|nr:hypothetical protein [Candidatus Acidoferrum sp.]